MLKYKIVQKYDYSKAFYTQRCVGPAQQGQL